MSDTPSIIAGEAGRPFVIELRDPASVGPACCTLYRPQEPGEELPDVEGTTVTLGLVRGRNGSSACIVAPSVGGSPVTPGEAIAKAVMTCAERPVSEGAAKSCAGHALTDPSAREDLTVGLEAAQALAGADVPGDVAWPTMGDLQILVGRAVVLAFDFVSEAG